MQAAQQQRILSLVEMVEAANPLHAPTEHLEQVEGTWRLLFSTITILVSGTLFFVTSNQCYIITFISWFENACT